jgi:hypothetical protein
MASVLCVRFQAVQVRAHGVWELGLSTNPATRNYPVFLLIFPGRSEFSSALRDLALSCPTPFVVIAPTANHLTVDLREKLAQRQSHFISLAGIDAPDGGGGEDGQQGLKLAMRDVPDESCYDGAALRLLGMESVIGAAVPALGTHSCLPTENRGPSLSERDRRVHNEIGPERFRTLTNAELRRQKDLKRMLDIEKLRGTEATDAAKSCFDRIRKAQGYPLSRQIAEKRSERK